MQAVLTETNTFKRWTFGDVRVTRVLEIPPLTIDPALLLQVTKDDVVRHRDWLCPGHANENGEIIIHFQAFIIEAKGKRIMVDTCIGNDKPRGHPLMSMLNNPFLERLANAGFPRESINFVMCTHLHVDHCGWNTMLVDGKWVPTFPNARYLFSKKEFEHAQADRSGDAEAIFGDSIKPIVDADLVELVSADHVVIEGIRLVSTPGHTPGHCSVLISSEGSEALITGDALHHPIQAALPHRFSNQCWDDNMAAATRRDLLDRMASRHAVMLGSHFAGATGVYITPHGDAWKVEDA
jgi:glyoxylase-like metal-dependent hydrolase (beta-lactamase superfamily II)